MFVTGSVNVYAIALSLGFGAFVAAVLAYLKIKGSSLKSQAEGMGLSTGGQRRDLSGYQGIYRSFYTGIEPHPKGGLLVSIAHPDQDCVLKTPETKDNCIFDIEVKENVLTMRLECANPSRPDFKIRPMIDNIIDEL